MTKKHYFSCLTCAMLMLVAWVVMGCQADGGKKVSHSASKGVRNSVYYWRTTFHLSDTERAFLKQHDIKRMYLRLFDVDMQADYDGTVKPIPVATLQFQDSLPQGLEIVPVVYITNECMRYSHDFADQLYKRIRAMAKKNGFESMREVQLDCDWSESTRKAYFSLCGRLREKFRQDSISLSATIRLHQLRQAAPPVDRGVLMLYNTGSIYNPEAENTILSYDDVKPYLQSSVDYPLTLSLAFPIYSWSILLHDNKFSAILHDTDFTDTLHYEQASFNRYRVKKDDYRHAIHLRESDEIRIERPSVDDIVRVKKLVSKQLKSPTDEMIIYHLDSASIFHFTQKDISEILSAK